MRRLVKFVIRRQQSKEVSRQNLIFSQNCDIIIIQSKKKITYKTQEFFLLVLDGFEDTPYKRAHIVQLNGGGPILGCRQVGKAPGSKRIFDSNLHIYYIFLPLIYRKK
jgi:hypothetical protein